MGYRIEYGDPCKRRKRNARLPLLTALCFLLFLMLVEGFWPEGSAWIRDRFLFLQNTITASFFDNFAYTLMDSETIIEAFSECLQGLVP